MAPGKDVKGFGGGWFENADSGAMNPSRNPREFLEAQALKGNGSSWFGPAAHRGDPRATPLNDDGTRQGPSGTKIGGGDWFSDPNSPCRKHGSCSNARKQASAMIAKIPRALSDYIARVHFPSGWSPIEKGNE